ncbi:MAG: hypothetical protein JXX14_18790 [Deltaproteobacteria bacterium]|nr:hypothetical protein [Deltaproteobacteria bacterium]
MSWFIQLAQRIAMLPPAERAIVEALLDRIEQGRTEYGPWKLDDGRDYSKEAFDEVIDALHYCAAALLKKTPACNCAGKCKGPEA